MTSTLNNEQLAEYVLKVSKDVFEGNEVNYITKTKFNKLTVLVAQELETHQTQIKDFYWGYYRHGFYSESINDYIHHKYGSNFHLNSVPSNIKEIPTNLAILIKEAILKYKTYFIQDSKRFYNWIYTQQTPEDYRAFYSVHRTFLQLFTIINERAQNLIEFFVNNNRKIKNIISFYYDSIHYIDDPEIMSLFRKFTDLVEYAFIKIKNGDNPTKFKSFFKKLEKTYDLFLNLLAPYLNTLKGDKSKLSSVVEIHEKKSNNFKSILTKRISEYNEFFEAHNLFPTFEEMENEMEELSENLKPENTDIERIYQTIGVSNVCIQ